MAINNSVTVDIKARADQASFREVRSAFERTIKDLSTNKSSLLNAGGNPKQVKQLQEEIALVSKLQQAYERAYNHNYHELNATQFKQNLKNLGIEQKQLTAIGTAFNNLGLKGQTAFKTISASVISSNTKLEKTHTIFQEMAKTMGNTIKWGISSSLMNSFTGAVSEAYGYVKNLDKSLNNIRIVGEKSADEMERFAISANKAAKSLGATTLDYTDASLIYYQQGLGDEQVKQMTDITIKMSNVLGTSADQVSDYMTAIWNNFAEGGENLEYYADVLTKLGAATASSAEEISTGLEKFAAISNTVGLSYEYATAALTTVTSKTRQSAEVVGTAFKTLFARIQDLELGETLDDGVTLGKYSEALNAVGINILKSNGELKDMDTILDEMGSKWQDLSDAQKVSLAQTVAGTRQYTQLVALMDNWDFFQTNLETATSATGSLEKQQSIYMESVEAHVNAASAAWEDFKDSLIDDSVITFFADLSKVLAGIGSNFLDGVGGGLPAMGLLGGVALRKMSPEIGKTIYNTRKNMGMTKGGSAEKQAQKDEEDTRAMFMSANLNMREGGYSKQFLEDTKKDISNLNKYSAYMNEEQEKRYKELVKEKMIQQAIVDEYRQKVDLVKGLMETQGAIGEDVTNLGNENDLYARQKSAENLVQTLVEAIPNIQKANAELQKLERADTKLSPALFDNFMTEKVDKQIIKDDFGTIQASKDAMLKQWSSFSEGAGGIDKVNREDMVQINALINKIAGSEKKVEEHLDKIKNSNKKAFSTRDLATYYSQVEQLRKLIQSAGQTVETEALQAKEYLEEADKVKDAFYAEDEVKKFNSAIQDTNEEFETISKYDAFTSMAGSAMQAYSGVMALGGAINALGNDNLSTGEKIFQFLSALATSLYSVTTSAKDVVGAMGMLSGVKIDFSDMDAFKKTIIDAANAKKAMKAANEAAEVSEKGLAAAKGATTTATVAGTAATAAGTGATTAATGATTSFGAALWSVLWPVLLVVAAIAALAGGIYALVKAYNKDADAAAAANEQVEEATKRYEELSSAAKELKETLSDYNDALDSLKNLTAGTEEFETALEKANEQAKELIETYGLWNDWSYGENGEIVISDEAQKRIQEEADKKAHTAERQMYGAKIQAGALSVKSSQTDLQRDMGGVIKYYTDEVGKTSYDRRGVHSQSSRRQLTDDETQFLTDALNSFGEELEIMEDKQLKDAILAMDNLPEAIEANIDSILKHRDALELQASAEKEFADASKYYAQQMMKNAIEDKYSSEINKLASSVDENGEVVTNHGRANLISTILANEEKAQTDKMATELAAIDTSKAKSNNKLNKHYGYDIKNDEDLARTYAEKVLGYTEEEASQLTYKSGNNKGTLKTKDGTKVLDEYSDDKMRKELARVAEEEKIMAKYEKDLDGKATLTEIENLMDAGYEAGAEYGVDFTDAFLQTVANGDKKIDLSSTFQELDPQEIEKLTGMEDAEVASLLGVSQEDWEAMGYTSAAEFGKAFKEGLSGWEWDRDTAVKNEAAKLNLDDYELESEELEDYAKHLMTVSTKSKDLADSLETDAEASAKVAKSVMRMNNGVEELAENFSDWKDVMKNSSKESEEYHEALSGMQNAVADLLDTEEDYVSDDFLQKHFDDIEKAADGDAEAIDRLKYALAEDIVMKVAINNDVAAEKQAEIKTWMQELQNMSQTIEIGTNIDLDGMNESEAALMEKMQNIINASGMTAEEANAAFASMGFQTNFAMEPVDVEQTVPNTVTETKLIDSRINPVTGAVEYQKVQTSSYQDGVSTFTGKQMQIKMEASGPDGKKVPVIDSVVRTGKGSTNNYSKKNAGGGRPGGNSSKPKKEKHIESQLDIYHDVNVELSKISNSLDKVQASTDQLTGQSRINNLAEQYALLNEQIDTTAQKIDIARGEMSDLQKELSGKGLTFDKDGTISNYASAYNAQLAYVNSVIDRYNSMSAAAQEKYQETYDKAKEDFDKFVEDIGRYDDLLTKEIPDLQADIQDTINKQIELKLDAFHQEIEIRLEMAEAERDWNAFFSKVIKDIDEDDILGNAEARLEDFMSYYKDTMNGVVQVNTKHIQDILADLKAMDNDLAGKFYSKDGVDHRAQALEDLQKYYEQLMEDLEAVHDLSDEIHESYVAMIDEAQEKFDEQISTFEAVNDLLEHDKNVISMIYGEESYSALSQFYDRQEDNYNKQLDFQKQQMVFWQAQMAAAEEGSDAWNAAKENWLSAVDAWNSAIETAIQNLQDKYLNAINAIFQNLNNNVTGGMGLDFIESEWDLINQNADQYLDTVNAIYKVQELQNKYLDAIDKTDSPAQQKKLNDLMQQETDYLREQDKLSEYDLERANLKYEIAMKQIALEEAQQNKTQLRLRRDSQGNYTYQYTQDDDQVASIQQEIADLYNQLYNLDADAYRDNLDEIYNVWSEFQERMAEAAQINDPEQRAAKELLIKEQYSDLINGLVEKNENLQANMYQSTMSHLFDLYNQNTANYEDMSEEQKAILDQFISTETDLSNAAFDNLFGLYNINIEGFKNMTDEQQDILMNSMIPQWNSGIQQMADKITGEGGFLPTCKDAFEELDQATEDYMAGIEELQKQADVNFEDIKNGVDEAITATEELLADNNELIDSYGKELEAIKGVLEQLDDLITKYQEASDAAKQATEDAKNYWLAEQNKNADVEDNIENIAAEQEKNQPAAVEETPKPVETKPAAPSLTKGSYVSVKPGTKWYADSYGGGSWGYARAGSIKYTSSGPYGYNIDGLGWIRKTDIVGYDTGGYTGDWNSNNGRLAMLHKKELVLNAHDTDNMLSAITIMRDLTANLGATLLNKMAAITSGNVGAIGQGMNNTDFEQSVVINAEFPNATSSKEIEDALNNLVNRASQHITK